MEENDLVPEAPWPICDNCGKGQEEGDWFTGRDGYWWCSACVTVIHDHEQIRGTLMVTCPECGWHLTLKLSEGTASRDRDRPNQNALQPPENAPGGQFEAPGASLRGPA